MSAEREFGAGDVPALLRTLGLPIVVGTTTTRGLVDRRGREVLSNEGMAGVGVTDTIVLIETSALPGAAVGAYVTVNGDTMLISGMRKIEDGVLTELICVVA